MGRPSCNGRLGCIAAPYRSQNFLYVISTSRNPRSPTSTHRTQTRIFLYRTPVSWVSVWVHGTGVVSWQHICHRTCHPGNSAFTYLAIQERPYHIWYFRKRWLWGTFVSSFFFLHLPNLPRLDSLGTHIPVEEMTLFWVSISLSTWNPVCTL